MAVVGPFVLFGLVLVIVGLWPGLKALLWVGAAVLVLSIPDASSARSPAVRHRALILASRWAPAHEHDVLDRRG